MLTRWRRHHHLGLALVAAGCALTGGWTLASTLPPTTGGVAVTTLHSTIVHHSTRFVTVHVRGKVIRRYDHILIVQVPRAVFRTRTPPRHNVVVPAHRVKIREPEPVFGETSAVVGVSPLPVTVTVQVPVPVPGPTTTVTGPATTVTLPQATTTVTVPTTITVSLPLSGE